MCPVGINGACNPGLPSPSVAQNPQYKGWGYVSSTGIDAGPVRLFTAYRWYPSYGWYGVSIAQDTPVYIWPYASGWSWIWTSDLGWTALHQTDLRIGNAPAPCTHMCPL